MVQKVARDVGLLFGPAFRNVLFINIRRVFGAGERGTGPAASQWRMDSPDYTTATLRPPWWRMPHLRVPVALHGPRRLLADDVSVYVTQDPPSWHPPRRASACPVIDMTDERQLFMREKKTNIRRKKNAKTKEYN